MRKEAFLLLLLAIFLTAPATAEITCSNDTEVIWDTKELDVSSARPINGLRVGLSSSDEISALNKVTANLFIDADDITLQTINSSGEIELSDGEHTVQLTNITGDTAKIKIDSSSDDIDSGSIKTIGPFITKLVSLTVTEPRAKLLIGLQELSLSNEDPTSKVTVDDFSYIVELNSASDSDATISVHKCPTGEIQEIAVIEINNTTINDTNDLVANDTNALINDTTTTPPVTDEVNVTPPTTTNISNQSATNISGESRSGFFSDNKSTLLIAGVGILLILIIIILIALFIKKSTPKFHNPDLNPSNL